MIDHAVSAITLISLFVLGPAIGRAILLKWDGRGTRLQTAQHIALGLATMLAAMIAVLRRSLERVAAGLAEEHGLKLPKRRPDGPPDGAQGHQRHAPAAVAFHLEEIVARH